MEIPIIHCFLLGVIYLFIASYVCNGNMIIDRPHGGYHRGAGVIIIRSIIMMNEPCTFLYIRR